MEQRQGLMQSKMMKPSQMPQLQDLVQQTGQQVFGPQDEEKRPLLFGFFHDEEIQILEFF